MRHAIRIQPYLPPDLFRKVRAYAKARSLTVSAVVAAALGEYLERDEVEDALLVRRLDNVGHVVEQLRRDLEALGAGFGRFVRYSFFGAPPKVDDQVLQRAEALYENFLSKVGEQLRAGGTFTRQVFPTHRISTVVAALTGSGEGGGEGGGRS